MTHLRQMVSVDINFLQKRFTLNLVFKSEVIQMSVKGKKCIDAVSPQCPLKTKVCLLLFWRRQNSHVKFLNKCKIK